MVRRIRFRHVEGGEVIESDLIQCKPEEWAGLPESHDPSWSTWIDERSVFALRLPLGWMLLGVGELDCGESARMDRS